MFAQTLQYNEFIDIVKKHHPLSKQADLQTKYGEAFLQQSRGLFDPKIISDLSQKYFNEKQYYSHFNTQLKIPTWFGIELKSVYENNTGINLNPEFNTPSKGLLVTGISLPLAQGLFIDKRRAELFKAKKFLEITESERKILLNELIKQASVAYWEWFKAYNKLKAYEEIVDLAKNRLEFVKNEALVGEIPIIDTLEAFIQYNNRLNIFLETKQLYYEKTKQLEVFLWQDGLIPLEISENVTPELIEFVTPSILITDSLQLDTIINNHPKINKLQSYIEQKKIDLQLYREYLKPQVNINYNPIVEPLDNNFLNNYSLSNYKWGLDLAIPILYRKERGYINTKKTEIEEINLQKEYLQFEYFKTLQANINNINATYKRYLISKQLSTDSYKLLMSEKELYEAGESSLFKLNSREVYFIKYQTELIDILTENKKAEIYFYYYTGNLYKF
jgi:outer membrane protein TolC